MQTASAKRHNGNQSRTATPRFFALLDHELSKPSGLDPKRFCQEHCCSAATIERYLFDLMSLGMKIARSNGVWRYDEGQARLFTEAGFSLFQRA
jgi:hypothetical protein